MRRLAPILLILAVGVLAQDKPRPEWPMFRGRVRAISEAVALESFVGQRFQAEVHLPEGSHVVEFLVTEAQLRAAGAEVAEA